MQKKSKMTSEKIERKTTAKRKEAEGRGGGLACGGGCASVRGGEKQRDEGRWERDMVMVGRGRES